MSGSEQPAEWLIDEYPCTVIATRYSGVFEGGTWAAFALEVVPAEAVDEDTEARQWWDDNRGAWWVAVGPTPNDAVAALRAQAHEEANP